MATPTRSEELTANWRTEIQEDVYLTIEEWLAEANGYVVALAEARDELQKATVYGTFADVAHLVSQSNTVLKNSVETILRILGQFDTPAQVSLATHRHLEVSTEADRRIDALSSVQRERVARVLREMFAPLNLPPPIDAEIPLAKSAKVGQKAARAKKSRTRP